LEQPALRSPSSAAAQLRYFLVQIIVIASQPRGGGGQFVRGIIFIHRASLCLRPGSDRQLQPALLAQECAALGAQQIRAGIKEYECPEEEI